MFFPVSEGEDMETGDYELYDPRARAIVGNSNRRQQQQQQQQIRRQRQKEVAVTDRRVEFVFRRRSLVFTSPPSSPNPTLSSIKS